MRWLERLRPGARPGPEPTNTIPYDQPTGSSDTPWRLPPGGGSSPPHHHTDSSEEAGYNLAAGAKEPGTRRETICGIRRKAFFLIIGGGALVTVAAIAIGIGAGIAFGRRDHKPPSTNVLNTESADITCPADHDAVIQARDLNQYFRLSCGIDYPVGSGAKDIDSRRAGTMAECIDMCADNEGCLGVSWDMPREEDDRHSEDRDHADEGMCVLKSSIGSSEKVGDKMLAVHIAKPSRL